MFATWILTAALCAPQSPEAAIDLVRAGKGPEALEVYRAALVERGEDEVLRRDAITLAFACRRWSDALAWSEGHATFARDRAKALFFAGRYEEALDALDPARDDEVFLVLDALEALGRVDEYAHVLDAARARLGEDDPGVATADGRAAARAGDFPGAVARFEAALAADPWRMEALFGLGRARLRAGDREGARVALEAHRRLVPLFDQLDFAERGVELDPTHGPNHARVGDLERAIGRPDRARAAYERGLARATGADRVPVVLRLARLHAEDRDDREAAIALLEAERARGFAPRVLVRLGDLLAEAGRRDEALAAYREVLAKRPEDRSVLERVRRLEGR